MGRRRDAERGVALVEMAVVVGLLAFFLFGIITFGVTLSFKQNLTQASNEAARAAAVAPAGDAGSRARTAADRVLGGWDLACDTGGLSCSFEPHPCPGADGSWCMTVVLDYDLKGHPRVPTIPGVDQILPEDLVSRVVVQIETPP